MMGGQGYPGRMGGPEGGPGMMGGQGYPGRMGGPEGGLRADRAGWAVPKADRA